jgi:HEAT repeat protein
MAQDRRSYDEYLNEIQNGWAAKRGQSAYELSFRIADPEDDLRRQADFSKTLALFETSKKERDPEVRRYLAVVLGHLGKAEAIEALEGALDDKDQETRLNATWGLGRIRDRRAVPALVRMLKDDFAGERKVACFALGEVLARKDGEERSPADAAAADALNDLLGDQTVDVRWNAALALARLKDPRALPLLLTMLDRASLSSSTLWTTSDGRTTAAMTDQERESAAVNVIVNAIRGVLSLGAQDALPAIDKLATEDKSYVVRQAALEAREKLRRADGARR